MLDLKFIRENAELVKQNTKDRLSNVDIDRLLELDKKRRGMEAGMDELRAKRNAASKVKPTPEIIEEMKKIGDEIKQIEDGIIPVNTELKQLLLAVPNLTHPEVVVSDNEDENPVLEIFGEPAKFDFEPKDHVQLAQELDLIDFDRATK